MAGGLRVCAIVLAVLANIALFMLAFRVLTAPEFPPVTCAWAPWWPASAGRSCSSLVPTSSPTCFRGAREAYGVFGLVLGLIAWIYLLALITVLSAEINVVAQRHLWPRALLTPFTDDVQLTSADERSYTATPKASATRASKPSTSTSSRRSKPAPAMAGKPAPAITEEPSPELVT